MSCDGGQINIAQAAAQEHATDPVCIDPLAISLPEDPLRAAPQCVTTGYIEVAISDTSSYNILAVPADSLILETMAGNWDNVSITGLVIGATSLDLEPVCVSGGGRRPFTMQTCLT